MQKFFYILIVTLLFSSCRKFVDTGEPPTQLTSAKVFNSNATATSAMLAIYAQMEVPGFMFELSVYTGMSADEMNDHQLAPERIELNTNDVVPANILTTAFWTRMYGSIYKANAVIEGLEKSQNVSDAFKAQLTGEALFLRAFFHFYLLRLYGDIPLAITTNYLDNANSTRRSEGEIFMQIEKDLEKAIELLAETYVNPTNVTTIERTRPNRYAAKALLSRVSFYQGKWSVAEQLATEVINATALYSLHPDLTKVFLKNSSEALWQIQPVLPGLNSYGGAFYQFPSFPFLVALTPGFATSFESGDQRQSQWMKTVVGGGTNYYHPFKNRVGQVSTSVTEYTMVLRLAELYLIRAETRARQGNFTSANADINVIRSRAGLPVVSPSTEPDILSEIEKQRRFELFAEAGDRWLDLRRSGRVSQVIGAAKPSSWTANDQLYPIPQTEINRNNLLTQNPGY